MKLVLVALAGLAATAAHAEPLSVRLKDGDTWLQTTVKTRTDERKGTSETVTMTSVIRATYHVRRGQPATLGQEFVSMASDQVPPAVLASVVEQAKLVFPAAVEVDEALTPQRVLNWSALRARVTGAAGADLSPAARAAGAAIFEKIDDRQAANMFKELGLISLGQGTDLDIGQVAPYEAEVPNAFGGPAIKTRGAFKLESYDRAARRAVVTWTQSLDPASAAESIRTTSQMLLARVAPEKAAEAKAQLADLSFKRDDSCRYAIDAATGLALNTECAVVSTTGAGAEKLKRTERWTITQSLPETH